MFISRVMPPFTFGPTVPELIVGVYAASMFEQGGDHRPFVAPCMLSHPMDDDHKCRHLFRNVDFTSYKGSRYSEFKLFSGQSRIVSIKNMQGFSRDSKIVENC